MDFELGEEDVLLRDTVRELCDQRVRPHAGTFDGARALPGELLRELGAMGLLAMERPEDEGGAGLGAVAATALIEELAAADGALALLVGAHNWQGLGHAAAGLREPERAVELPAMASGERIVAWALPEGVRAICAGANAGADGHVAGKASAAGKAGAAGKASAAAKASAAGTGPAQVPALSVTARRDDDAWVLDGEVRYVLGAAVAGRLVIFADTDAGPTAWLVDADAEGVHTSDPVRTLGARAAGTAHMRLAAVRVPDARRLGESGAALTDAWPRLERAQLGLAAVACGILRGALEAASAYAQERRQFGQPLAAFQAIQWKLADMATTLDAAWLLTLGAAWRCDAGRPYADLAARARLAATTAAVRGTSEALQIYGGYGYTREFPVERSLRDARACEAAEGGGALSRMVLAGGLAGG